MDDVGREVVLFEMEIKGAHIWGSLRLLSRRGVRGPQSEVRMCVVGWGWGKSGFCKKKRGKGSFSFMGRWEGEDKGKWSISLESWKEKLNDGENSIWQMVVTWAMINKSREEKGNV